MTGLNADLATLRDSLTGGHSGRIAKGLDALARVEAELSRLREVEESFKHLSSEYQFDRDRGDHLVYREEWERFDRWQRLRDTLEEVDFVGAEGFAADMVAAAQAEASRLREERDALEKSRNLWEYAAEERAAVIHQSDARADAAEARCARLEEERDEYRIEADHGHDDYEDAEAVIRQIAETRPNQAFDPWARDLCQEFLDRPRRSRQTIAAIRERCARLQQALAMLWQHYLLPISDEQKRQVEEALAGPDTPTRPDIDPETGYGRIEAI